MKLFICIGFLVIVFGPCVRAKSFNFGNFFFGSGKKDLDSDSAVPPAASQSSLFNSESLYDSTEFDSESFNSSADDIFDFDYQNSSSDGLDVSNRNESDNSAISISDGSDNSSTPVTAEESNNNVTNTSDKSETTTSTVSSTVASENATSLERTISSTNTSKESQSTIVGEQEGVVLGTTTGSTVVLIPKTILQKSIDWVEDAYTLSILIPVTAGVLFATTIIIVIALCRCLRRCCRRRSFKRKPLPDSVKNLRPSDRARLLGDCSSDEEF